MCKTAFVPTFLLSLVLAAAPAMAQECPLGEAGNWDLRTVYPDDAAWNAERDAVLAGIAAMPAVRARPLRERADLLAALAAVSSLRASAGRMARFALLASEVDSSDDVARARQEAATGLEARVEDAVAWLAPAVRALDRDTLARWVREEPALAPHRRRLDRIARGARAGASEDSGASLLRWARTSADVYDALMEADLKWPALEAPGTEPVALDRAAFNRLRRSPDRAVRDAANRGHLQRLQELEAPLGLLLGRRIEADLAAAKAQGFTNSIDAAFVRDDALPPAAWRTLVDSARANRPTLLRLERLLARAQGQPAIEFADLYAQPEVGAFRPTLAQSMDLIVSAAEPLGPAYQEDLRARFRQPWMHLAPAEHKSGTVGVFWQVGGGHPYGLMTFNCNLASSRTLAALGGLLMWYADIPPALAPDRREEDPAVHGNAIWYLLQNLHDDELMRRTTKPRERVAILVDGIYRLRNNFYNYAVTTELEQRVLAAQERGEPLTGAQVSAQNLALLREYFGDSAVDDRYGIYWATYPQLFYSHTQVVFGVAAAAGALWAERVTQGDARAIAAVRLTQTAKGSQYSADLLQAAGIDVATPAPYEAVVRRLEAKLDELECELDRIDAGTSGSNELPPSTLRCSGMKAD